VPTRVTLVTHATSLGGVETLIEAGAPATAGDAGCDGELRRVAAHVGGHRGTSTTSGPTSPRLAPSGNPLRSEAAQSCTIASGRPLSISAVAHRGTASASAGQAQAVRCRGADRDGGPDRLGRTASPRPGAVRSSGCCRSPGSRRCRSCSRPARRHAGHDLAQQGDAEAPAQARVVVPNTAPRSPSPRPRTAARRRRHARPRRRRSGR